MSLLFLLLVAHGLCDYPLQGDFLAKAKNPTAPIPGVPWQHAMAAHGLIHGGAVYLITGSIWLGLAELALHCVIDLAKCHKLIDYNADQGLHVGCKVLWAVLA